MSSDDPIDAGLARVPERPHPATPLDDGLLLAYHRGELSPEKSAEVDALLARDPEARALLVELTQPVDTALVDRLSRLIHEQPAAAAAEAPVDELAQRRIARRPLLAGAGVLAAAAAIAAAVLLLPKNTEPLWPAYELEVEGFVATKRGEPAHEAVLNADSRLVLRLRPEQSPATSPVAAVWIVSKNGVLEPPATGKFDSNAGAFRFVADAGSLFPVAGHYVVAVHLASSDSDLQRLTGLRLEDARRDHPGVGWWTIPLEYVIAAP